MSEVRIKHMHDRVAQKERFAREGRADSMAWIYGYDAVGNRTSVQNLNGIAGGALVFLFALLGVLITAVLWAEMLIRAAISFWE